MQAFAMHKICSYLLYSVGKLRSYSQLGVMKRLTRDKTVTKAAYKVFFQVDPIGPKSATDISEK